MNRYNITFTSGRSEGSIDVRIPEVALPRLIEAINFAFHDDVEITVHEVDSADYSIAGC